MIITDNTTLFSKITTLKKDDIICGRIRLKRGEEHILLDLAERGVKMIPSASSQLASRSKAYQARLFAAEMVPHTKVIYDESSLLKTISLFHSHKITSVILKQDRKNAGLGIHIYNDIEDVFNQSIASGLLFPFVIQPFIANAIDIRVVIIGDYLEAYKRVNPHNFRNNLHCGGKPEEHTLTPEQLNLCFRVMKRGGFPYAHLDLMIDDKKTYLAEINLRGGLKGAKLSTKECKIRIDNIQKQLCNSAL